MKALEVIGDICVSKERTIDDVVGKIVQLIAQGELKEVLDKSVADTPQVAIPKKLMAAPTKNNIEKLAEVTAA
jgi:hypothetical protein